MAVPCAFLTVEEPLRAGVAATVDDDHRAMSSSVTSIKEEHKESVPEHIKDIKSINQKLFNSFDEKIKNVSKSAIDIARETAAHMHHSTNKSEE